MFCGITVARVFLRVKDTLRQRQHGMRCWMLVQKTLDELQRSEEADQLWTLMGPVFAQLGVAKAQMFLRLPCWKEAVHAKNCFWHGGNGVALNGHHRHSKIRVPIHSNGTYFGQMRLVLGEETRTIPGWFTMIERLGEGTGLRLGEIYREEAVGIH